MNFRSIAIALTVFSLATGAPTLRAMPRDQSGQPCAGLGIVLCQFLPIAPDMDDDVDLTKQISPGEPAVPAEPAVPRAGICGAGCA